MVIWVGSSVSPQILRDLFGVDDVNAVNPHMVEFPFFWRFSLSNNALSTHCLSYRQHFLPRFTIFSINGLFNEDGLPKYSWLVKI
jgi:hypothetical protein